jgi:hypothetical protein
MSTIFPNRVVSIFNARSEAGVEMAQQEITSKEQSLATAA